MRHWAGSSTAEHDVIIVGGGPTGLACGSLLAAGGRRVAVIEKSSFFGGTAACAAALIWVPCNPFTDDDPREAERYLTDLTRGRTSTELLRAVVAGGPRMMAALQAYTEVRFSSFSELPDYHVELPGGRAAGRTVEPALWDGRRLGSLRAALRDEPIAPMSGPEFKRWSVPPAFPQQLLRQRLTDDVVSGGRALAGPLIRALNHAGATLITDVDIQLLDLTDGVVTGVVTDAGVISAPVVVLACGGFEWNSELTARYLSGPAELSCSPPHNTGAAIVMANQVGAAVANLDEAWWATMAAPPGTTIDGAPTGQILRAERTLPGSIMVNRAGRRFVDEAANYHDVAKAMHAFDAGRYGYRNIPAFLLVDAGFVRRYGLFGVTNPDAVPAWIHRAASQSALAAQLGVIPEALVDEIARFNRHCRNGIDSDFQRGEYVYDRAWGDPAAPHPTLGPVEEPPFFGLRVYSGAMGTRGGVLTDPRSRALRPNGDVIPGLYAVGNAAAHPVGFGYAGAGSTLGPGLTMAYLAAKDIAGTVVQKGAPLR